MEKTVLYGHLERIDVKLGQTLTKGARIGEMGNTGYSFGTHLHVTVVPGTRLGHWFGSETIKLGGTKAMIEEFINAAPLIQNKNGLRNHIITSGWYGYEGHGAIDLIGPDRTSIAGASQIVWNQDGPGLVVGIEDFGNNKTGKTVLVKFGKTSASGGSASAIREYTVKKGDSLWEIAKTYGTTVNAIAKLNAIDDPSKIYPGQVLKLSGDTAKTTYYTVISGDNLTKISEKVKTPIDVLVKLNGITNPSLIFPGQVLKLTGMGSPQTHKVVSGEYLSTIANTYGLDWREIALLNDLNAPYTIYPGQLLKIR